MLGSWHLGDIAGIRLRVHWTFLILIVWVYLSTLSAGAAAAISSTLFVLAIFGCVLLHELGHALAARQYGIDTRDITILPIGGVAALERMPRNPWQELVIAIAGPIVNVVIAAAILLPMWLVPSGSFWSASFWGVFLARLAWVNVILVVFNLIPAFPMDGGRVLRALLAFRLPYATATHIAARVGQLVAVAMGLFAIFSGHWMLLLVAGFVFLAASGERMMVLAEQMQRGNTGVDPANEMVFTSPVIDPRSIRAKVPAEMSAESAMRWLQWHGGEEFSVVSRGAVIGRLNKLDLVTAIANGFGSWPIARLLRAEG
jgi:Zn-dependent protease